MSYQGPVVSFRTIEDPDGQWVVGQIRDPSGDAVEVIRVRRRVLEDNEPQLWRAIKLAVKHTVEIALDDAGIEYQCWQDRGPEANA